jgi:DNA repair protein RadD
MELIVDLAERKLLFAEGNSVVWLAHTEELCEQAIDSFSAVWAERGAAPIKVARLWGSYAPPTVDLRGALIVAGTGRVHGLRRSNPNLFKDLCARSAVVVLDEAHRALAPSVKAQITELRETSNGILVGLSATPARTAEASDENVRLAAFFGRNLIAPSLGEDPILELRRRGVLAEVERIELNYSTPGIGEIDARMAGEDEDLPEGLLKILAENPERNLAILNEITRRVSSEEPAIVFCCSTRHAELLAAALRLRGVSAAAIDCTMRRGSRRLIIQQFSEGEIDVLLNYGVLSTGFDAPNVQTVVIARPTRSVVLYSQMLGRGLRGPMIGGTTVCTLVDVRDHLDRFGDLSDLYLRFSAYWEKK